MNILYHVTKYVGRAASFVAPGFAGTLLVKAAPALRLVQKLYQRWLSWSGTRGLARELLYIRGKEECHGAKS